MFYTADTLYHHGVKGMKWGVRRYQNSDGTLTPRGEKHYYKNDGTLRRRGKKFIKEQYSRKMYRETKPTKNDPYQFKAGDKSWAFNKKIDSGFVPAKKDFAKYVGPREKTLLEKARENRRKNTQAYRDLLMKIRNNNPKRYYN